MMALIGALLIAASFVFYAAAYAAMRHHTIGQRLDSDAVASTVAFVFTSIVCLGGSLIYNNWDVLRGWELASGAAAIAGSIMLAALVMRACATTPRGTPAAAGVAMTGAQPANQNRPAGRRRKAA